MVDCWLKTLNLLTQPTRLNPVDLKLTFFLLRPFDGVTNIVQKYHNVKTSCRRTNRHSSVVKSLSIVCRLSQNDKTDV